MKLFTPIKNSLAFLSLGVFITANAQDLPTGIEMQVLPGGTFTMGSSSIAGNDEQKGAATVHEVTLSPYSLSEAEITNSQYLEFLNAALNDGLIEVVVFSGMGPDDGQRLIQGTSSSSYEGKVLYAIDGTRVMKDHDDADGDEKEFTGVIEPENPLNIAYIGFNEIANQFYLKNPHDADDFNWYELCNYYDYGTEERTFDTELKNDFDDWAGAGNNYSDELEGWTAENPSGATKLPTHSEVAEWPVTFVRWWGAKAFADYYNVTLPTDAHWEFAAKGGSDFQYAVYDGVDISDANWNTSGIGTVAYHHVRAAISGNANPFGLYNMAGNAWEWIYDNYQQDLGTSTVTDPLFLDGSTIRVWRGGSWNYHDATLQSAFRDNDDETRGNDHFGFRVAGPAIVGIGAVENQINLNVYPNPSTSQITVQVDHNEFSSLRVFNAIGILIKEETFNQSTTIDVSHWPNGIYFVNINGSQSKFIKK